MFRTDEIIKASKLPPEGVAMSRHIDYIYFVPCTLYFVCILVPEQLDAISRKSGSGTRGIRRMGSIWCLGSQSSL